MLRGLISKNITNTVRLHKEFGQNILENLENHMLRWYKGNMSIKKR